MFIVAMGKVCQQSVRSSKPTGHKGRGHTYNAQGVGMEWRFRYIRRVGDREVCSCVISK